MMHEHIEEQEEMEFSCRIVDLLTLSRLISLIGTYKYLERQNMPLKDLELLVANAYLKTKADVAKRTPTQVDQFVTLMRAGEFETSLEGKLKTVTKTVDSRFTDEEFTYTTWEWIE